jgi:predicted transcriptional regulator
MKRTQLDIMIELIAICKEPIKITRLMQTIMINHKQVKQYTQTALSLNLLKVQNNHYIITEKGRCLIE